MIKEPEANPCIDMLCKKLEDRNYQLQVLYLNNCQLQDEDGINIIDSIKGNMRKLYLNQNCLTKLFAIKCGEILGYSDTKLREIGLKWNQINGEGGCAISKALAENKYLKLMDISWNKIGKQDLLEDGLIGTTWGNALASNKTLVHLDMSFNKIGEQDTKILGECLMSNQTLIGLHY